MRASQATFALISILMACSGKERPFGEGPIDGLAGAGGLTPGITATPGETDESGNPGLGPTTGSEGQQNVGPISPSDISSQSGRNLECDADPATCDGLDAGPVGSVCVPSPRDCTSELDNDCDGVPDDVLDDICQCVAGATEPCDEHPGLDGQGECQAGLRTCLLDGNTRGTAWGECAGSVGPRNADSCEPGDDGDCDGTPNEGCSCVDGATQDCGSNTDTGPCQIGTSTCVDGRFGPCIGAVAPARADSCSSRNDDSNCNGIPFEGCSCSNGETQPCGATDNGICQLGTRTCANGSFGQCVGQIGPSARDCRSAQDNDCDGVPDNQDPRCECTGVGQCGDCNSCNTNTFQCQLAPANSGCSQGRFCTAGGQCVQCTLDSQCGANRRCQNNTCVANCLATEELVNGQCRLRDGQPCSVGNDRCRSTCRRWFRDADGDTFGDPNNTMEQCGTQPSGFIANGDDCCDSNLSVRPNQTAFFETGYFCAGRALSFDYDCRNGEEFPLTARCEDFSVASCPNSVFTGELSEGCGGLATGNFCSPSLTGGMLGQLCEAGEPGCACRGTRAAPIVQTCR